MLGYEAFRELEERSSYGLVQDIVTGLLEPYELPGSQLAAFTRLFFGALSATASSIALAPDPQQASDDAEGAVMLVLAGIRSLLDGRGEADDPGNPDNPDDRARGRFSAGPGPSRRRLGRAPSTPGPPAG